MNFGRKLLIIGAIMLGISYSPLPLLFFGIHPSFLKYDSLDNFDTISLVPEWAAPFVKSPSITAVQIPNNVV